MLVVTELQYVILPANKSTHAGIRLVLALNVSDILQSKVAREQLRFTSLLQEAHEGFSG